MPMNVRSPTSPRSSVAHDAAWRRTLAGGDRVSSGIPSTRAKSLPRPPGRTPSTPSVPPQRSGDRADEAVAAEGHGRSHPPPPPSRASSRGVLEAARALGVELEAAVAPARPRHRAAPCPPGRRPRRVDDQHQLHRRHQSVEILGDGDGRGLGGGLGLGSGGDAGEHDRGVEPGGSRRPRGRRRAGRRSRARARGRAGQARSGRCCGSGLPTIRARRCGGVLERGDDRARARATGRPSHREACGRARRRAARRRASTRLHGARAARV